MTQLENFRNLAILGHLLARKIRKANLCSGFGRDLDHQGASAWYDILTHFCSNDWELGAISIGLKDDSHRCTFSKPFAVAQCWAFCFRSGCTCWWEAHGSCQGPALTLRACFKKGWLKRVKYYKMLIFILVNVLVIDNCKTNYTPPSLNVSS